MEVCNGFFLVGNRPHLNSLHCFIKLAWPTVERLNIFLHKYGYFIVKFLSLSNYEEVVGTRLLAMGIKLVIIHPWTEDFDFKKEVLHNIPVLVKLPNLPLACEPRFIRKVRECACSSVIHR